MSFVLVGLGFFVLVVLSHVLAYRLGALQDQMERFVILWLFWSGIYALWCFWAMTGSSWKNLSAGFPENPWIFTSFVLYSLLCLTYLTQSLAVHGQSPSMMIVSLIHRHPRHCADFETLLANFSDEQLIFSRLKDLVRNGYVTLEGDAYCLTARGEKIARFFDSYQRLIKRTIEA